ncbi:MAG: cadmium-translocating P-type ATPase [Candidatus Omnitrophica bacterium]|nr:cadmium-translocating P-type ATPase [Candidatus Omnitrophota bacterium]
MVKYKKEIYIAFLAVFSIAAYLVLRFVAHLPPAAAEMPLYVALTLGGVPLVWDLTVKLSRREFGSDLLAGISIVTSVILGEYLAGTLVVLMLSGGEALEEFAVRHASSVLEALARRIPHIAHRKSKDGVDNIAVDQIRVGDTLVIFAHEICPVDGAVVEGSGTMDEAYLTGEPFVRDKTPGSQVLSGAINGEASLTIRATKLPVDSRYAKIMQVMREAEQKRPRIRRLADKLGAWYTPLAVLIAVAAWVAARDPMRFLAVLVIATPCPLLIAIPVAIIGSISLSARRGIVVKNPAVLEVIDECSTMILDKTGTLTYGRPELTDEQYFNGCSPTDVLRYAASLEKYSRHPLAAAIEGVARRRRIALIHATEISEPAGEGLQGVVDGRKVLITSRKRLLQQGRGAEIAQIPEGGGLECVALVDGRLAAHFRFHDEPREEGRSFIDHLNPRHRFNKVMIVSGDREEEVRYLAEKVGIDIIHAGKSPEEKIDIVRRETAAAKTIFMGDGINDAPALTAATVGIAFGQNSDITSEAAGVVIMESSLAKMDEFLHIGRWMRRIALQSAVGGMALSLAGMGLAAAGYLSPVTGAICQEVIDLFAVLNALRVAIAPKDLTDFDA